MGRVVASLVSYPPARFIGSELYTHALLKALKARGHYVTVHVLDGKAIGQHEGIPVMSDGDFPARADLLIQHPEYAIDARTRPPEGAATVLIAHNARDGVLDGVAMTPHDLLIATSYATAQALPGSPAVYTPPQPRVRMGIPGNRVTLVNANEDKGGWIASRLAERMPDVDFLFVAGGYGEQFIPEDLPNVMTCPHIPPAQMNDRVWRFTRALLMPSVHESWGSVASEAMARGVPVVASPTPGLVENLGDAGTFVPDRGDLPAWETAIRQVIGPAWSGYSQRAIRRAHRPDGIERLADDLSGWIEARRSETDADSLSDVH